MAQAILFARTGAPPEDDMPGLTVYMTETAPGEITVEDDGTRAIYVSTGGRTGEWKVGSRKRTFGRVTLGPEHADGAWEDGDPAYLVGDGLAVFLARNVAYEPDPPPAEPGAYDDGWNDARGAMEAAVPPR
jgi:hypothetical protein